jgi:hypothetical protein
VKPKSRHYSPEERIRATEKLVEKLSRQAEPFLPKPDKRLVEGLARREHLLKLDVDAEERKLKVDKIDQKFLKDMCTTHTVLYRLFSVEEVASKWTPGMREPSIKEVKSILRKLRKDHDNALALAKTEHDERLAPWTVVRASPRGNQYVQKNERVHEFKSLEKEPGWVLSVNPTVLHTHVFVVNKNGKLVPLFKWTKF